MKKPVTKEDALIAMAGLCARSEQCESDVYKKLRVKGLGHSEAMAVIDELKNRNFIDDFRYARSFARDKVRFSAWGRMKIRAALAAKRITSSIISQAFEEIDPLDYSNALKRCASLKARTLNLDDYDDRMKLARHILSRGFESALVNEEIRRLRQNDD